MWPRTDRISPNSAKIGSRQLNVYRWFDGFRNYRNTKVTGSVPAEHLFPDRAHFLTLAATQWTALNEKLKTFGTNPDGSQHAMWKKIARSVDQ